MKMLRSSSFGARRVRLYPPRRLLLLLLVASIASLCGSRAAAATFVVTTLVDEDNGTPDAGVGSGTSLREAINAANAQAGDDTITFTLPAGAQTLTLTSALPNLSTNLAIQGPGANVLTVARGSSAPFFRIFTVSNGTPSGPSVTLAGLAIKGGSVPAPSFGGGVLNDRATLVLRDVVLAGNSAEYGGGVCNYRGATLTIVDSAITGNSASNGGGICNYGDAGLIPSSVFTATLNVSGSTVASNTVTGSGGGIYTIGSSAFANTNVQTSTLQLNHADQVGGGIAHVGSGTININRSAILTNTSARFGGGLANTFGDFSVTNSTIASNYAETGAGIYNGNGLYSSSSLSRLSVSNCTLTENWGTSAAAIATIRTDSGVAKTTIGSTIIKQGVSGATLGQDGGGTNVSAGYNLCSNNGGGVLTATGDQVSTDPKLGPLQSGNGPAYYEPLPGSPAIDQGASFNIAGPVDQRGQKRIFNFSAIRNASDGTDVGAVELIGNPNEQGGPNIVVTNTSDVDGGNAYDGDSSLREAIIAAIDYNIVSGNAGATISFGPSFYSSGNVISLATPLPTFASNITIVGPGADRLIVQRSSAAGTPQFSVFSAVNGANVTLVGLTIMNGYASQGGGIYNKHARLTLVEITARENRADWGGGLWSDTSQAVTIVRSRFERNAASSGGAVYLQSGGATVDQSFFIENKAEGNLGGAFFTTRGLLAIDRSLFVGNSAAQRGGAIHANGEEAELKLASSTFSNNTAPSGGALCNEGPYAYWDGGQVGGGGVGTAKANLINCTFSGNSAQYGGAIANRGLWFNNNDIPDSGSLVRIDSCTFSANTASAAGGAIYNWGMPYQDQPFDFPEWAGAGVFLRNSIINQAAGAGPSLVSVLVSLYSTPNDPPVPGNAIFSQGYNLSSDDGGGFFTATGDQTNVDPKLGPLVLNGGSTPTHALLAGSPAINTGNTTLSVDQRGVARPQFADDDKGAFELQAARPPSVQAGPPITIDCAPLSGASVKVSFTVTRPEASPSLVAVLSEGSAVLKTMSVATPANNAQLSFEAVTFAPGVHPLTITVTDGINDVEVTTSVTVNADVTAPQFTFVPPNQTATATSTTGATVSYPAATATDSCGGSVSLSYSKASGSVFPIGETTVVVTAKDANNNTATASFKVTIEKDTTPPTFTSVPPNQSVNATSPSGATVNYPPATATDPSAPVTITYSKASGTVFPIGDTTVTVTATDAFGNSQTASFVVHVFSVGDQIDKLIALIQSWGIHKGIENALVSKLRTAQSALARGDSSAARAALEDFSNLARAQRGKKLSAAQSDELIAAATRIIAVIGGQ